jgi:LysM repeat protein
MGSARMQRGRRRPPPQLPPRVPTVPTLLAAITAVILAFVIGRATAGGGSETTTRASKVDTTTTTTTQAPFTHVVGRGDTLSSIAAKYGISVGELKAANGITNDVAVLGAEYTIPRVATTTTSASTTVP